MPVPPILMLTVLPAHRTDVSSASRMPSRASRLRRVRVLVLLDRARRQRDERDDAADAQDGAAGAHEAEALAAPQRADERRPQRIRRRDRQRRRDADAARGGEEDVVGEAVGAQHRQAEPGGARAVDAGEEVAVRRHQRGHGETSAAPSSRASGSPAPSRPRATPARSASRRTPTAPPSATAAQARPRHRSAGHRSGSSSFALGNRP